MRVDLIFFINAFRGQMLSVGYYTCRLRAAISKHTHFFSLAAAITEVWISAKDYSHKFNIERQVFSTATASAHKSSV